MYMKKLRGWKHDKAANNYRKSVKTKSTGEKLKGGI
jgi:hypothetical protein